MKRAGSGLPFGNLGVLALVLPGLPLGSLRAEEVAVPKEEAEAAAAKEYEEKVQPLLQDFCFDCHGDGSAKGDLSLDKFKDLAGHLQDHELWMRVWQNVRTQLMPPAKEKSQPTPEERKVVSNWIERQVFKLDPDNPDPGRVTIRRMNREEYRNTIRDVVGVDFDVTDNFPPDDTGFGFDTIGDVLTLSPLLMEKYLAASEEIAEKALPSEAGKPAPVGIDAADFREAGKDQQTARFMEAEIEHTVGAEREFEADGKHTLELTYEVEGKGGSAKGLTATWRVLVDGNELEKREIRWDQRDSQTIKREIELSKGRHRFEFHIAPGGASENPNEQMGVRVAKFELRRVGGRSWDLVPESFKRIYFKGPPPKDEAGQAAYMREIVERFATRAIRRPAERDTVDRLTALAVATSRAGNLKFLDGVRFAVTAILTSPRFLFRSEIQPEPDNPGKVVPIDEYALASRLSYFLWSSAPDEELLRLAGEGKLRAELRGQVDRLLADDKSHRLVRNFVGQWLQARDVQGVNIDARRILREDDAREAKRIFNNEIRRDMRIETEKFFEHVLRENRPVLELLTANYSFLNENLAKFYGVEGVGGREFRKVEFGEGHRARGGILAQGTFLIVTSNPTRTSPVKRGLFVLDNILGVPAPPAPPDVPELDEARKGAEEAATMRQLMELHREKPLCKSCHARMDPIGLALENFNAIGQWRVEEEGKPIDTAGKLITGEEFGNVMELKTILATSRKQDFYRCLTEKLLTYALGRGVEYYDAPSVDKIVEGLNEKGGALRELVYGIVDSAPFQKRRGDGSRLGKE